MAQRREWDGSGTESSELDEDAELRDWELGDGAGDEDDEADGASGEADEASDEADVDPFEGVFRCSLRRVFGERHVGQLVLPTLFLGPQDGGYEAGEASLDRELRHEAREVSWKLPEALKRKVRLEQKRWGVL